MVCRPDVIGRTGLAFFGAMSASNFHEINNALAIINENAGLLGDLIHMADDGSEMDLAKLDLVSARIIEQVGRTREIVKTINRFSHSVEHPEKRVDLGETVVFVAHLAHRFAHMNGVAIKAKLPPAPVKITTSPFFLENLVWLCLDFAMQVTGDEKVITISTGQLPEKGFVRFSNLSRLTSEVFESFKKQDELAILDTLEARIAADLEKKEVLVTLPVRFSEP
ncbi:MAG: hypothetical protein GY697_06665 [Desulfobacterales bacterium]|nr:hypothetical protein [Desulfobacterales bacterium]